MQATGTLRDSRSARAYFLAVLAVVCALVLGAAGGYAARSLSPATGGAAHAQQPLSAVSSAPASTGDVIPDSGLIP